MRELSDRTASFTDSVIRRMTRIANQYGAINLSQGFPDFDPPAAITNRLAKVAGSGPHQYALTWGAKNLMNTLFTNCQSLYSTSFCKAGGDLIRSAHEIGNLAGESCRCKGCRLEIERKQK